MIKFYEKIAVPLWLNFVEVFSECGRIEKHIKEPKF